MIFPRFGIMLYNSRCSSAANLLASPAVNLLAKFRAMVPP